MARGEGSTATKGWLIMRFRFDDVIGPATHSDGKCQETLVCEGDHLTPAEGLALVEEGFELLAQKVRLTHAEVFALANMVGDADVVRQVLRGERVIKAVLRGTPGAILNGLLEEVGNLIELPAVPVFVASEKFVDNRDGEVPIAYICGDSKDFLNVREENVPAAVLRRRKVLQRATDLPTLHALGGEIKKARVAAAHVYAFLRDEASVFEGYTLFILGASGNPLSLHIWYDDGWHIEVLPVPYPRELEIGDLVLAP
jgi:hypothetical protein